jgi:hypothetical protein
MDTPDRTASGPEAMWGRIEHLRFRVRSMCRRAQPDELESVDREFAELREQVWRLAQLASSSELKDGSKEAAHSSIQTMV